MSAPRTPSKRSLARMPSMGSSFASCFGASTPISPRRMGGHGLLGGHACVNYRRLGFEEDEDEDEYTHMYEAATAQEEEEVDEMYEHVLQRREGPFKHFALRESGMLYASEGEEHSGRGRKPVMKLGTQWSRREKAGMQVSYASESARVEEPYASEQEGEEQAIKRKGIRKLAKLWSMREKDTISYAAETPKKQEHYHATDEEEGEADGGYVRERKGVMKLVKLWTMREKARRGVHNARKEEEQSASSEEEIDEYGRERNHGDLQLSSVMREKEGMCVGRSPLRRESFSRKVREACVQVLESARRSSPHLSELFVGNQLLMQVTSSSFSPARRARRIVPPSTGFLVVGDPPLSIHVSPPRSSSSSAV